MSATCTLRDKVSTRAPGLSREPGGVGGGFIEEEVVKEFYNARNREEHARALAERLRRRIVFLVFNSCCSVVKQVLAGVPIETVVENFKRKL